MDMTFIMELVGRYILTGAILWGALILMLIVRLAYKSIKSGDAMGFLDRFICGAPADNQKLSVGRRIVRLLVWPYGICESVHVYMKHELIAEKSQ